MSLRCLPAYLPPRSAETLLAMAVGRLNACMDTHARSWSIPSSYSSHLLLVRRAVVLEPIMASCGRFHRRGTAPCQSSLLSEIKSQTIHPRHQVWLASAGHRQDTIKIRTAGCSILGRKQACRTQHATKVVRAISS